VKEIYHLADGLLLRTGKHGPLLHDLRVGHDQALAPELASICEELTLGATLEADQAQTVELRKRGWIVPGPAAPDEIWGAALRRIDDLYYHSFAACLSPRARAVRELLVKAHSRRKHISLFVGQCAALPETVLRRALQIGDAERVGKKRIVCIGDDDLMSVALAYLGHDVTVLDLDVYLLGLIEEISAAENLAIEVREVDLCQSIESLGLAPFDVFLTDPTSSRDCFEIFLSRAISLSRPGTTGFVAVYPLTHQLFDAIAEELRLSVSAWHGEHNRYYTHYGALHAYMSDWVQLELSERCCEVVDPHKVFTPGDLYSEQYPSRKGLSLIQIEDIDELGLALPFHLNVLLDQLAGEVGAQLLGRQTVAEDDWSLVLARLQSGFWAIHVNRARRNIVAAMYPHAMSSMTLAFRHLLAVYKRNGREATVSIFLGDQDLRAR